MTKRKKSLYLLAILIIGIFELNVFYKIFTPKTDEHYKLYYIDKKLANWSHGNFPIYSKGYLLTHKSINPYISKNGWSKAEKTIRWTNGRKAAIYLPMNFDKSYQGFITMQINTLGKQEIKYTINDHYIGSQVAQGRDINLTFKFNPNILHKNNINKIEFEFPDAHKPDNGDQRILAMALKSFRIE